MEFSSEKTWISIKRHRCDSCGLSPLFALKSSSLGHCIGFLSMPQKDLVAKNKTNVLSYSSGSQKSKVGLTGLKKNNQDVGRAVFFLEVLERICFLTFSSAASRGHCIP